MVFIISELVVLLLLYSKTDTVLFCKKVGKKLFGYGYCNTRIGYSAFALF